MQQKIHPTALVDPGAKLGDNISIGAYSVIEGNVVIDDDAEISHHVVIFSGTRLGKAVRVHPGAIIGDAPQDLKYQGEETTVEVGDMTVIRECATINRGTTATRLTRVGSNCLLMAYSHVAHDCRLGNGVILANSVNLAGHVTIEDNVIIGGLTGVHQFVTIGTNVMIGALFRVSKDVPPYVLAGGQPLSFEGLNLIGLRRRGFSPGTIETIANTYHIIYRSKLNVSQALQKLSNIDGKIPEVENIIRFIQNSKRGIIPAKVR
jgi:UDP-N-acetylglucosamine acyltransferase